MKIIDFFMLITAIVLAFVALFYWLAKGQIDYAAFYFAISTGLHSVYLHSTKANKSA